MENYYAILGVSNAATPEEIRRAYRVLARRYHPDVNPGRASEERFKTIARAYDVLSDIEKRRQYDAEIDRSRADPFSTAFDRAHQAYRRQQANETRAKTNRSSSRPPPYYTDFERSQERPRQRTRSKGTTPGTASITSKSKRLFRTLRQGLFGTSEDRAKERTENGKISDVSIIEVSLSVIEAIKGVKKTVEIEQEKESRKISVTIPPGVRPGSVVRFRRKEDPSEEIVLIVRIASHRYLHINHRGIVFEAPISIGEALRGGKIQVPTLEEPVLVTVEPGTQSGTEVRLKEKGVRYRDGSRGDLFIRFMIHVPESPEAVGLKEKAQEMDSYYSKPVRHGLPKNLLDL